jgi:hypothetical protein
VKLFELPLRSLMSPGPDVADSVRVEETLAARNRPSHDTESMAQYVAWRSCHGLIFPGQLREEGQIAVEFLRQTTEDCLGRDHLAVDHPKQLYRVDAQLRTELEYIRTPGHAKVSDVGAEPAWFRRHGHGGSIKGKKKASTSPRK